MVLQEWMTPASRARWLPFVVFMALLALRGAWEEGGWLSIDSRWIYAVSVLVVGSTLLLLWRHYGELRGRDSRPVLYEALWAVAIGLVVFKLWIELTYSWMYLETPAATFRPVNENGLLIWPLVIFRWLGATLVVPVMEELFWRSFLMRWIDRPEDFQQVSPQQVSWRAIVLSSAVFALAHSQWLAALVTGVIYAWLYKRTGKLWVAVLAHAVTNGVLGVWVVLWGNWAFW